VKSTGKILRYQLRDVIRGRWILVYTLVFLLMTDVLFRFGGSGERVVLSLMNVVLLLVPLVSIIFGTMYLYHAREFIVMLLAQPVDRTSLFLGLYGGMAIPLAGSYAVGVGLPFLWHAGGGGGVGSALGVLLLTGVLLTCAFTALAFLVAVLFEDRAKGFGAAVLVWLLAAVVYDGVILLVVTSLWRYPLERPLLVLTMLNPIDLGRVFLLLQFDIAALMGYTGAVFNRFFGSAVGKGLALTVLVAWSVVPLLVGLRRFRMKDF
jgi:Cu-processing system permease protein